jgi:hypothetical protein
VKGHSGPRSHSDTDAAGSAASKALRSEVEVLLSERGCPVCRFVAQAEDRFFSWFAIESHSAPEMIEQLRAALGLCPAHTRHLLDGNIEAVTLTSVYTRTAEGTADARITWRS